MIYTDVTAARAERRDKLSRCYRFDCLCAYCDLPDEEAIARSDSARAELRDWRHTKPTFAKWSTDLCREDDAVILSHQKALELIEQEGMHGLQINHLEPIALSYAVLGDEEQFRVWAQRVIEMWTVPDPERAAEFSGWLANPQSMEKWGWRKKQRLLRSSLDLAPSLLALTHVSH